MTQLQKQMQETLLSVYRQMTAELKEKQKKLAEIGQTDKWIDDKIVEMEELEKGMAYIVVLENQLEYERKKVSELIEKSMSK